MTDFDPNKLRREAGLPTHDLQKPIQVSTGLEGFHSPEGEALIQESRRSPEMPEEIALGSLDEHTPVVNPQAYSGKTHSRDRGLPAFMDPRSLLAEGGVRVASVAFWTAILSVLITALTPIGWPVTLSGVLLCLGITGSGASAKTKTATYAIVLVFFLFFILI